MDTYTRIELTGDAMIDLEVDTQTGKVYFEVGADGEDGTRIVYLTEEQALAVIAELSVKVAQARAAKAAA